MGLKEKLANAAIAKLTGGIKQSGSPDGIINSVLNTWGNAVGVKTVAKRTKVIEKDYLLIQTKSYSLGTIAGVFKGKIPDLSEAADYRVVDTSGKVRYDFFSGVTFTDRTILTMFDKNDNEIGCVKEHLMSAGLPILEKEVKKCSVYHGKEKLCTIKKYYSLGSLEFDVLEGDIGITDNGGDDFKIQYNKKHIADLRSVPINFKDGYSDIYVMEYEDSIDVTIPILVAIGIYILLLS